MDNKIEEAAVFSREALRLNPEYPEGLSNLGLALQKQGDRQAAIQLYEKALSIKPNALEALINLSAALKQEGKFQETIACCRKALSINPNDPDALLNLGIALGEEGKSREAIACYRKALSINPNRLDAFLNLGGALAAEGELQEAITTFRQAISLKEDYAAAHFSLSLSLLSSGDYEKGWEEYEWRLRQDNQEARIHAQPRLKRWNGCNSPSEEKLILVSEQGLGDVLQFMRYIPHLRRQGMAVSFCAPTKLHSLIQASGITVEIYSPEQVDQLSQGEWLPLLSLPRYLNVSSANPLVDTPYIKAPQKRILFWREKLAAEKRPIIGINWQGSQQGATLGKSLPLAAFAPIIEKTEAGLLSLQKGHGSEQMADCPFRHRFVGCQEEINETWDFVETAAMIANCDLIITCDTAVAHLAAGMGQPTWVLLVAVPDWRWGTEGETTFWYPSMRLFRQRERGNWPEVMDRVVRALQSFSSKNVSSVEIPIAFAELLDKITILEIKSERFRNEQKQNVDHELKLLQHILEQSGVELLSEHHRRLKAVNESLWQIEEDIRSHEADGDFGETFVQLARSVYL